MHKAEFFRANRAPTLCGPRPIVLVFARREKNCKCAQKMFILADRATRVNLSTPKSQATGELGILAGIPARGRPVGVLADESPASDQPERR